MLRYVHGCLCACIAQERTEHTRQPAHTLCATLQLCRAERLLLSGVSGSAAPGRLTAIMGPSGSGKTTLLSALAGQMPYSSSIRLEGHITANGVPLQQSKLRAGFVQQDDLFYPQARPGGLGGRWASGRAWERTTPASAGNELSPAACLVPLSRLAACVLAACLPTCGCFCSLTCCRCCLPALLQLTVRETLMMAAELRMGKGGGSAAEREAAVDGIISRLGLAKASVMTPVGVCLGGGCASNEGRQGRSV